MRRSAPFLWGAQYYRAPTPHPGCWTHDLDRAQALGFTDLKIWAQWRWAQRWPDRFDFDDLLQLADAMHARGLRLTVNTIFDVAPAWVLERHPDCVMIGADNQVVTPRTVQFRQLGGFPGPCLRHAAAAHERRRFLAETVQALRGHPAMFMWDVWNEPEQNYFAREPRPGNYVCYCAACRAAFIPWLQRRHASLEQLNTRWGRCYVRWEEVEAPRNGETLVDWVDWREFQLDSLTEEARWRMALVASLDPDHAVYLHVVPSTMEVFNSISGPDDFALARLGTVFAATCNGGPQWMHQLISAGQGRPCYNVESHINYGSVAMHQRLLSLEEVSRDLVPQIGMGVAGFLFWQFRSETLGCEGPAWGIVHVDGSDRPVTRAIERFSQQILPWRALLESSGTPPVRIGVWKSRRNEIFHYAAHGSLTQLCESVDGYVQALYWLNLPFRFIDAQQLAEGACDGLSLLILPSPYCLGADEAAALDRYLHAGGHLLSEAHLGAWDPGSGRHQAAPGHGLAERWGIAESETTSSYHLAAAQLGPVMAEMGDDLRKALAASGAVGGQHVPIDHPGGLRTWGCERFALITGRSLEVLGTFAGLPCLVAVPVGRGRLVYAGTRWGQGSRKDPAAFATILAGIARAAGVAPTAEVVGRLRVDLRLEAGQVALVAVTAGGDAGGSARLALPGRWRGLLWGGEADFQAGVEVAAGRGELYVRADRQPAD